MVSYIYNSAVYLKSIESKQGCSPESNWQEPKSRIMWGPGQLPVRSRRPHSMENNHRNIVGLYTHHAFLVHSVKHSLFPETRGDGRMMWARLDRSLRFDQTGWEDLRYNNWMATSFAPIEDGKLFYKIWKHSCFSSYSIKEKWGLVWRASVHVC